MMNESYGLEPSKRAGDGERDIDGSEFAPLASPMSPTGNRFMLSERRHRSRSDCKSAAHNSNTTTAITR
jgi:hypothetical protein